MDREGRNIGKQEVSGSGQSMRSYILTYSRLQRQIICQLWALNGGDLNFCVPSTSFPGRNYRTYLIVM